jgi:hypothetical protein
LEEKVCKRISIILSKTTILMKFYNLKKNKKTVFAKNRMCVREREKKRQNMGWYKGKHSKETTSGQPLCK